jgi:60 kDa SS-A/Ro ribonucleoprotein
MTKEGTMPRLASAHIARAHPSTPGRLASIEPELRDAVLGCGRGQRAFEAVANQVAELVPKVRAEKVAALAIEAREQMNLSKASLLLVREMCRHRTHRALVADTLARVVQRPDELVEFVAIYWSGGRVPLSAQAKKGLAAAFVKFDEQQLAKCNSKGAIKLRDVLFLCHAKARDEAQAAVWKKLIWGRLRATQESKTRSF